MSSSVLTKFIIFFLSIAASLPALDKIRVETRSDQASTQYGVSGKGVIYAMIDRGIDWENNDFRNSDGTTRIAYIFDLTDNTGASDSNNPYGKGTIYTQAQINQALKGGTPIPERDYVGHGTANTAVAAGNGSNVAKYHGIAPQATILTVKLVADPTPAYGTTPCNARISGSEPDPDRDPVRCRQGEGTEHAGGDAHGRGLHRGRYGRHQRRVARY
jgi:minor extracellular serine protease Vpr